MPERAIAIVALEIALLLVTGLVAGRSNGRTAMAAVLACVCVALPLALPAQPAVLRFLLALGSLLSILRTIEARRDRRADDTLLRMFAFVAPLDALAVTRARPRLDGGGLVRALGALGLGSVGVAIVLSAPHGALRWPVATLGAAIGMLGAMDALALVVRATLRAVGIESPVIQDTPIRSRSVAELWSRRWNRAVGRWLRTYCFSPLARRGRVGLGVVAAFVASAAIHFWPVLVAVGLGPALAMGAFFLVQALLIAIEARLGVARWSPLAGHVWTIGVMLASSPLFTVPLLLVLGWQ